MHPSYTAQHPPESYVINGSGKAVTCPAGSSQAGRKWLHVQVLCSVNPTFFITILEAKHPPHTNPAELINLIAQIHRATVKPRAGPRYPEGPSPEHAFQTLQQKQQDLRENKPAHKYESTHVTLRTHAVQNRNSCLRHLNSTSTCIRVLYFTREHSGCFFRAVNMFYLVFWWKTVFIPSQAQWS